MLRLILGMEDIVMSNKFEKEKLLSYELSALLLH